MSKHLWISCWAILFISPYLSRGAINEVNHTVSVNKVVPEFFPIVAVPQVFHKQVDPWAFKYPPYFDDYDEDDDEVNQQDEFQTSTRRSTFDPIGKSHGVASNFLHVRPKGVLGIQDQVGLFRPQGERPTTSVVHYFKKVPAPVTSTARPLSPTVVRPPAETYIISDPGHQKVKNVYYKKLQPTTTTTTPKYRYYRPPLPPSIPTRPSHDFKFVGVVHDNDQPDHRGVLSGVRTKHQHRHRVPIRYPITPPPVFKTFDHHYVYDDVGNKPIYRGDRTVPLRRPTSLDIPVEISQDWIRPSDKTRPVDRPQPSADLYLKPESSIIVSSLPKLLADQGLRRPKYIPYKVKTKPVYDTFGIWVPSANPWQRLTV